MYDVLRFWLCLLCKDSFLSELPANYLVSDMQLLLFVCHILCVHCTSRESAAPSTDSPPSASAAATVLDNDSTLLPKIGSNTYACSNLQLADTECSTTSTPAPIARSGWGCFTTSPILGTPDASQHLSIPNIELAPSCHAHMNRRTSSDSHLSHCLRL